MPKYGVVEGDGHLKEASDMQSIPEKTRRRKGALRWVHPVREGPMTLKGLQFWRCPVRFDWLLFKYS